MSDIETDGSVLPHSDSIDHMNLCLDLARAIEAKSVEIDELITSQVSDLAQAQEDCNRKKDEAQRVHKASRIAADATKTSTLNDAETKRKQQIADAETALSSARLHDDDERKLLGNKVSIAAADAGISILGFGAHSWEAADRSSNSGCTHAGCGCIPVVLGFLGLVVFWPTAIAFVVLAAIAWTHYARWERASKAHKGEAEREGNIRSAADREYSTTIQSSDNRYIQAVKRAEQECSVQLSLCDQELQSQVETINLTCDRNLHRIGMDVDQSYARLDSEIRVLNAGTICGSMADPKWTSWQATTSIASCLRIGVLRPKMQFFQQHFPGRRPVEIPFLVDYRSGKGIVIHAGGALNEARYGVQNMMLRLLGTLPPAAVKFVFIDPVSLGGNVAGFMQMEKYEPSLIGGKAWSDQRHIEHALTEVTEHMETVIQKYLREEYKTIEEYNATAYVKEAYRVIVVFDFPVNFTESSAKKLTSIMRNGPRCGVFPIVIRDIAKPLPYGFSLPDLEQFAYVLHQSGK